jgi:hypothetical protein
MGGHSPEYASLLGTSLQKFLKKQVLETRTANFSYTRSLKTKFLTHLYAWFRIPCLEFYYSAMRCLLVIGLCLDAFSANVGDPN